MGQSAKSNYKADLINLIASPNKLKRWREKRSKFG